MRRLRIWHETRYDFAGPVQLGPHRLMLRPRESHDVRIESSRLTISPAYRIAWHRDPHDNSVATLSFAERTQVLIIASEVIIQHFDEAPLDFLVSDYAVDYPFAYLAEEAVDLWPYVGASQAMESNPLRAWLARFWRPGNRLQTYVLLNNLCRGIAGDLAYRAREEPGVQTPSQTLSAGSGSCRDFATLFMEAARALGLAARFVSGYLHAPATERGFGTTHAWAEVYLPGAGWKGFDPTIGELTGSDHIPVAVARRPDAVPPVAGSFIGPGGARPGLHVRVQVTDL